MKTDKRSRKGGGTAERKPRRVVIENVFPEIDGGQFPVKRTIGETVTVTADIHTDGHDLITAVLRYRDGDDPSWRETPLR